MLLALIGVSSSRSDLSGPSHILGSLALLQNVRFTINSSRSSARTLPSLRIPRLPFGKHGPDRPGQFVGNCRNHYVVGPAFEQRLQPRPGGRFVAFEHNRSCRMHQQRSQICVPTFADAHLPHSTACATLARHQSDPRGELSRVFERLGIAHAGNNRGCGEQANARYLSNALASRGLTQLLGEPAFDLVDTQCNWNTCLAMSIAIS